MIDKFKRLFHTLKYLKRKQIAYRIFYFSRKKWRSLFGFKYTASIEKKAFPLVLSNSIYTPISCHNNTFSFLNKSNTFSGFPDWNFSGYGKLWTYNLNYFDFLNQKEIDMDRSVELINNYIDSFKDLQDGFEPFPIALRGMNWIKFFSKHKIIDAKFDHSLYAQYKILEDQIEYHLLGNHLLENGFSLLFASYYFKDTGFYRNASDILVKELKEQILPDGAHFELSPMYHQIMLFRLLDCIDLVKNNDFFGNSKLPLLEEKASLMLGWLMQISFADGSIPLLNDSANGVAPSTNELFAFAKYLKITPSQNALKESGYRVFKRQYFEMIVDVGDIGPDYIPGHAHSDTFNFELHVHEKPFIVDTGTSTYEVSSQRFSERSTSAHNTVRINNIEQSEVWSAFRVAKRAKVLNVVEGPHVVSASHDGYKSIGIIHSRKFEIINNDIFIKDNFDSFDNGKSYFYMHFHPDVHVTLENNLILADSHTITCIGKYSFSLSNYNYSPEFNKLIPSTVLIVEFEGNLETCIRLQI